MISDYIPESITDQTTKNNSFENNIKYLDTLEDYYPVDIIEYIYWNLMVGFYPNNIIKVQNMVYIKRKTKGLKPKLSDLILTHYAALGYIHGIDYGGIDYKTIYLNILPKISNDETNLKGPIDTSNWLIKDRLLMSALPSDQKKDEIPGIIKKITNAGINVIVNLMEDQEFDTKRHYITYIPKGIEYISFPIKDNGINDDTLVLDFVSKLVTRFFYSKNIMIHCWGGHGRTGTIAAILYGIIYLKNGEEALKETKRSHNTRVNLGKKKVSDAPQTDEQKKQVIRILDKYLK